MEQHEPLAGGSRRPVIAVPPAAAYAASRRSRRRRCRHRRHRFRSLLPLRMLTATCLFNIDAELLAQALPQGPSALKGRQAGGAALALVLHCEWHRVRTAAGCPSDWLPALLNTDSCPPAVPLLYNARAHPPPHKQA